MSYEQDFPFTTTLKLTRDEIVKFASQYDPQPFHLDEESAKKSIYGGLIASGLHCIHKMWDVKPKGSKYELIAGLGFTVKFSKPIYADVEYICEQKVLEKKNYIKLDNSYIYKMSSVIKNEDGEILFDLETIEIIRDLI
tara:strand:+ start:11 stop:427 length:417 start_codon:yes stop_codon:yes gene_type:complete